MGKTQKPFRTELGVMSDVLVNHVLKCFDDSEKALTDRKKKWQKNAEQYFNMLPEKTKPWIGCSNIQPPASQIVKDTIHANLMKSYFRKPSYLEVRPVSVNDYLTAQKRQQYLNWQLREEVNMRKVGDAIFDLSLIFGNAFTKTRYVKETANKITMKEVPMVAENGEIVMVEQPVEDEVVVYDGVKIDVINIDDFYLSPDAVGVERGKSEYDIVRTRVTRNEYMSLVEENDYAKIDFKQPQNKENLVERVVDRVFETVLKLSKSVSDASENNITLLEWYGEYFNEKDGKVYELIAVVHPSSRTLCKVMLNNIGERPFVNYCPYPIPNQVYGEGVMDKLKYLQAELNTIHNQRLDSATMRICSPVFYNRGSDFDAQNFTLSPGLGVPVDDVRNIFIPNSADAPASQYREEEAVWRYIEQATGVNEGMQGVSPSGDTTATEVVALTERAGTRFELIYSRYETSFKKQYEMVCLFNQLFMPPEKEFRVLGRDGQYKWDSIKKIEMSGKLDLEIYGNSVANEASNIQKAQMVYQTGLANPLIVSDQTALYEHTKYLYDALGVMNTNRMIPKPPQAAVRTPEEEMEMMYQGRPVEPDLREDAQKHLLIHIAEVKQPEFIEEQPEEIQKLFNAHITATQALVQAQQTVQQVGMFQQIGSSRFQPGMTAPAAPVGGAPIKNEVQ